MERRLFLAAMTAMMGTTFNRVSLADTSVIQLVYFHNYSPFSWDEGNGMQGILIDLLNEALKKRMNIQTIHNGYPWKRAQKLVKVGLADGFCTVPTPARHEYTVISREPTILVTFNLFISRESKKREALLKVKNLEDLKDFQIGHYLGSGWANKNLKGRGFNLDEAATLDAALAKLAAGRVDVVIDTSQVLRYRIQQLELQNAIEELPQVLDQAPFSLCIGKHSPFAPILPYFESTMRKIHKDGTFDAIVSRYG
ncbi:substrate-binding periplasmic protein [Kiloniella sp.]|uniref:substrate-binding periplasmic protein n=1 Tax=Kiloniella sp. TaxID=1938587 RepID=UPI003B02E128